MSTKIYSHFNPFEVQLAEILTKPLAENRFFVVTCAIVLTWDTFLQMVRALYYKGLTPFI